MDPKPRPIPKQCLDVLRKMTPEQRLQKAIELTELANQAARDELRKRFPDLSEPEIHQLYLIQRLDESHQKSLIALRPLCPSKSDGE